MSCLQAIFSVCISHHILFHPLHTYTYSAKVTVGYSLPLSTLPPHTHTLSIPLHFPLLLLFVNFTSVQMAPFVAADACIVVLLLLSRDSSLWSWFWMGWGGPYWKKSLWWVWAVYNFVLEVLRLPLHSPFLSLLRIYIYFQQTLLYVKNTK